MSTLYVVRQKPCGCLVSSRPAREGAEIGQRHEHQDKSTSVVLPLETAACVPEWCKEHRPEPARLAMELDFEEGE